MTAALMAERLAEIAEMSGSLEEGDRATLLEVAAQLAELGKEIIALNEYLDSIGC